MLKNVYYSGYFFEIDSGTCPENPGKTGIIPKSIKKILKKKKSINI